MYSSGDAEKLTMTADAAACLGGRVVVAAVFVPSDSAWSGGTLTGARILSCTPVAPWLPTYGEAATLTGTPRRWWWFLAPGYGAAPATDAVRYGMVLLVDGRPVPLFSGLDEQSFEHHRRFGSACDGQVVTVRGRWEASKNPRAVPPVPPRVEVAPGRCSGARRCAISSTSMRFSERVRTPISRSRTPRRRASNSSRSDPTPPPHAHGAVG